jgi:hypothetical protein
MLKGSLFAEMTGRSLLAKKNRGDEKNRDEKSREEEKKGDVKKTV